MLVGSAAPGTVARMLVVPRPVYRAAAATAAGIAVCAVAAPVSVAVNDVVFGDPAAGLVVIALWLLPAAAAALLALTRAAVPAGPDRKAGLPAAATLAAVAATAAGGVLGPHVGGLLTFATPAALLAAGLLTAPSPAPAASAQPWVPVLDD